MESTSIADLKKDLVGLASTASRAICRLADIEAEIDRSRNNEHVAAEIAELRRSLGSGGKPAEAIDDPLISNTQLFKILGVSRHSQGARRALREVPGIEISNGRFKRRRSAIEAYLARLEAARAEAA
ncbi:MAG: hypothetical protein OEU92_07020 [Alphaproteobacteria bacterium]|nr:hypothetical protein [Alphaproteobacteria bacterium]